MTGSPTIFDRRLLAQRRRRIAGRVADHDFLLERVAGDFVERLSAVNRPFECALNLGAHTGLVSRQLRISRGIALVVDADPVNAMLRHAEGPRVVADEEALPFRDASFDLVVSGLALQFVNDLPGALVQVRRILKPDGLLLASLTGGATLTELRQSFVAAEAELDGGASPRVAPFTDVRDLGMLLQRAGFALPVVDSDSVTVAYPTPLHLMRELRAMGATNVLIDRQRKPLRRTTLTRAAEIYAERFSRADGRVTATFEILTMTAWAPHPDQQKPLRPGSARSRLADALGTRERPAGDKTG